MSHSDGQAAAETVVEEGSENWQMGNAGVEAAAAAAVAGGAAEYGPGAAAEAAAGTAAGVRPPRPVVVSKALLGCGGAAIIQAGSHSTFLRDPWFGSFSASFRPILMSSRI